MGLGNFIVGLQVTVVGFGVVFVILTLLMFVIGFQANIINGPGKKTEAAPKAAATPAPQAAAAPAPVVQKQDDSELVAVIAAAIAASGGSTKVIKSITRITGASGAAWTVASRADAMNRL